MAVVMLMSWDGVTVDQYEQARKLAQDRVRGRRQGGWRA